MKMNEFMTALETHLTTQQPNYPNNAEWTGPVRQGVSLLREAPGFAGEYIKSSTYA